MKSDQIIFCMWTSRYFDANYGFHLSILYLKNGCSVTISIK